MVQSSTIMPTATEALPGRTTSILGDDVRHTILGHPLKSAAPAHMEEALLGMGCFWGAERLLWKQPGVWLTAVGYAGGLTPHATYDELCTGKTGHAEVVRVVFDPAVLAYADLLRVFFENHDPTQGMRQGGDVGTQYRSVIFTSSDQQQTTAEQVREQYQTVLDANGFGTITTEILPSPAFYYAEAYHQQYLDKNPDGYCGIGGVGVSCPIGLGTPA